MPKVFHCSKCQEEHARPVGKKCMKTAGESFSSADPLPAPPSPGDDITASDQILLQLRKIGEKILLSFLLHFSECKTLWYGYRHSYHTHV